MIGAFMLLMILVLQATARAGVGDPFDDKDLQALLTQSQQKREKVILYTWSPQMVLSQKGLDEILTFAKSHRVKIIHILDPFSNQALAQKMADQHHWPSDALRKLRSKILIGKGARVHYPSYTFIANGQIKAVVPGYKTWGELEHYSNRYLK